MVAADLTLARAEHRRRMEAKAKANAARSPLPHRNLPDPAPARTYGIYQLLGPGHPTSRTMDKADLEDNPLISVAGVPNALSPGLLRSPCKVRTVHTFPI